jgi:predicted kinase
MQKWTRDRSRRRQKSKEQPTESKPAQAPLQPAYFDAEGAKPDSPSQAEPPATSRDTSTAELEDAFQPGNVVEPAARSQHKPATGQTPQRRRRRRRGGSGRGTGSKPAAQATPGGVSESATDVSPTPFEEEAPSAAAAETIAPAAPSTPDAVPPAAPAQTSKGVVVLAIGLPGSGKSSWFKRHNIRPLSSDLLRELLFDNVEEQRFQDLIFSNLRSMLKARLIARRPTNYVDATNLTPHDRQSWIKLAKDYRYDVQAVYFDVPVEVCLERNQRRERVVPEDVMRRFASKLRAPTFEEGFSKITVVRVKKKE